MHACSHEIALGPVNGTVGTVRRIAIVIAVMTAVLLATVAWIVASSSRPARDGAFMALVLVGAAFVGWLWSRRRPVAPTPPTYPDASPAPVNRLGGPVTLCRHGIGYLPGDEVIAWDRVDSFTILAPPRGGAGVAVATFRAAPPAGLPQARRLVPGDWVPADERVRWLGGVERADIAATDATVGTWRSGD